MDFPRIKVNFKLWGWHFWGNIGPGSGADYILSSRNLYPRGDSRMGGASSHRFSIQRSTPGEPYKGEGGKICLGPRGTILSKTGDITNQGGGAGEMEGGGAGIFGEAQRLFLLETQGVVVTPLGGNKPWGGATTDGGAV